MPHATADPASTHFFALSPLQFEQAVKAWGWPAFRAGQVLDWVYQKGVVDPSQMSNLSLTDRRTLADRVIFAAGETVHRQLSEDGTLKLLLSWPGGANAETVMIPDGPRRTACISSQVGCPVGCQFCASGIGGVKGNLTAGQIVEQVFVLNRMDQSDKATKRRSDGGDIGGAGERTSRIGKKIGAGESFPSSLRRSVASSLSSSRITNIVFMGMGEPLANYANVMAAVRILHDPRAFNIGARKITISTVGVPSKIRQLAEEKLALNLAISLHAPNEKLRRQLIPWAEHFALEEILDAARHYFKRTGREITLEYILLSGVNDRPDHARQLALLCRTLRANVNLIRYNEVSGLPFKRPLARDVVKFQEILRHNGVNAHVRKSRGRDIDAACGQLRRNEQLASASPTSTSLPVIS